MLSFLSLVFTTALSCEAEIRQWHQKREEDLKKENDWLNLAGLFWLNEGVNTFGGRDKNIIVFLAHHSDAQLEKIILRNGKVAGETTLVARILDGDKPLTQPPELEFFAWFRRLSFQFGSACV